MATELQDRQGHEYGDDWKPGSYDGQTTPAGDSSDPRGEYDPQKTPLGDSSDPRGDLAGAEAKPGEKDSDDAASRESAGLSDRLGKGYTDRNHENRDAFPANGKKQNWLAKVTKKRAAIGLTTLVIGGGSLFSAFSILQGPLQLIHLSEILQKPLSSQNDASKTRVGALLRYARSGEVGETRVSWWGSRSVAKTTAKLEKIGFTVDEKAGGSGRPVSYRIDTSKFAPGKSTEQVALDLAKAGIPEDHIFIDLKSGDRGGTLFVRNPKGGPIGDKISRLTHKFGIGKLYEGRLLGKTMTWIKSRPIIRFSGNSLHLLKKVENITREKAYNAAKAREAKRAERSAKAKERAEKIRGKLKPQAKILGAVGLAQMGICVARDIAGEVPLIQYSEVVKPSMDLATDSMTYGDQTKSGQDFNSPQNGAVTNTLKDENGGTIWQGKALDALAGGGSGKGEDLDPKIKGAFSSRNTASDVEKLIDSAGGEYLCSTVGQIAGAAAGLVALALVPATGGGSEAAYTAARVAASTVLSMAAIKLVMDYVPDMVADTPPMEGLLASAPHKGDLMAFGSVAMANDFYRKSGGAELDQAATAAITSREAENDRKDFQAKNYFARIFDISDYRSLVGQFSHSINPSFTGNIRSFTNIFFNIGSTFFGFFSSLAPKVHADEEPYDFGFPKYGFSDEDLNNPALEDPYDNAERAAQLLTNNANYIERAKACFGVDITQGSQGWQVDVVDTEGGDPEKEVLPSTTKYEEANCAEDNLDWLRIRMFIFDSRTMQAYSCYDGDDEACASMNIDETADAGSDSTGETGGTLPSGNAQDLAKKLKKYIDNGTISCNGGQGSNCPDILKTASGESIKNASCYVDALDPNLLGMILKLVESGHKFVFSAICSDHPSNPNSLHHHGRAIDFNYIDGTFIGPSDVPWDNAKLNAAQKLNKDIASFMPKSTGFGQQQCHPGVAFDFLQGFDTFIDACHHQHIQIKQ